MSTCVGRRFLSSAAWRAALGMAAFACAGCAVDRAIPWGDQFEFWSDAQAVIRLAAFILLAALGESYATTRKPPRSVGWLLLLSLGAGAVHALVYDFAYFCRWTIKIPNAILATDYWDGRHYGLAVLYWPLLAALTWLVIPLSPKCVKLARPGIVSTICGVALCVLGYASYKAIAIPRIAAFSVEHDFPFRRTAAVQLLHLRAYPGFSELLWRQLENDRWLPIYDESVASGWNWRQTSLYVLAEQDRDETARRLSELLRRRPRYCLADEACELLVDRRRYECAPILLRYALAASADDIGGGRTKRLVTMGIPQAASLIFRDAARSEHFRQRLDMSEILSRRTHWDWVDGTGTPVSPEERADLKRLLHVDAGENLADWMIYYGENIDTVETPLTRDEHLEAERTIDAFWIYLRGLKLWRRVEHTRIRQYALDRLRIDSPDDAAQIEVLNRDVLSHRSSELFDEKSRLARALSRFDDYFEEGHRKVSVPSPNWDVLTTDELEQEMAGYLRSGIVAAKDELGEVTGDDANDF